MWRSEWPTEPGWYWFVRIQSDVISWRPGGIEAAERKLTLRIGMARVRLAGPPEKPFLSYVGDGHFLYPSEQAVLWGERVEPPEAPGADECEATYANWRQSRSRSF